MRTILETSRVPAVQKWPSGRSVDGVAFFTVRVFDAGEEVPDIYDYAQTVSEWLGSIGDGKPLRSAPPANLSGPLHEAVVPRGLLESLPAESLIAAQWEFTPGGKR